MVLIAWNRLCRIPTVTSQLVVRCNGNLSRSCNRIHCLQSRSYATKSKPALTVNREGPLGRRLFLLIIPMTTFALGTWQIFRLQWKLGLIKDLEMRTSTRAVPLASVIDNLDDMEYYRVIVTGYFDHNREQYIGPRSLHKDTAVTSMQPSESGMNVITPFICNEPDITILVNRGWVPRSKVDPSTRQEGQIEGETTVTGVIRHSDRRRPFMPHNDPEKGRWFWRESNALAALLGTSNVFIDADARSTLPGGPIGGQTRVTLRNEHLQYIFTWYTLSLITFYLYVKFWKKPKPAPPLNLKNSISHFAKIR